MQCNKTDTNMCFGAVIEKSYLNTFCLQFTHVQMYKIMYKCIPNSLSIQISS